MTAAGRRGGAIRLSKKFGVNPSLNLCWWCGKDKNEIILAGVFGGKEAPHKAIWNYDPCDACKEAMEKGIVVVEACDREIEGVAVAELQQGVWATGSWSVITEDAVRRIFKPGSLLEQVLEKRKTFMDQETYQQLFEDFINKQDDMEPV